MRRSIIIRGVLRNPIDLEKLAQAMVTAARAQRETATEAVTQVADEQPTEKAS